MARPNIVIRLQNRFREQLRRRRFVASVAHLQGPTDLDEALGEVVLIVLVRDGAYYPDAFFGYYRGFGAVPPL